MVTLSNSGVRYDHAPWSLLLTSCERQKIISPLAAVAVNSQLVMRSAPLPGSVWDASCLHSCQERDDVMMYHLILKGFGGL